MTARLNSIRITNAALEKIENGKSVLRGVLDLESSHLLITDDYQREQMPLSSLKDILEALEEGEALPDIELGMRGGKYKHQDEVYSLYDPVYIIDGLQRHSAVTLFRAKNPGKFVRLGVAVHFETNKEWERERFNVLNTKRRRVHANKLLFNRRETSDAIMSLYTLSTTERLFPLHERISWRQNKSRGEYFGAMTFARVVGGLHSHKASGLGSSIDAVVGHLDKIQSTVGKRIMRDNVQTFFELIDECWGLRHIQHQERTPHIKFGFMYVLARLLSDHYDFWRTDDEKRLFIDQPLRKKLRTFQVMDPVHNHLCGAAGKALDQLYIYIRDEVNKGKRSKHLRSRNGRLAVLSSTESSTDDPELISPELTISGN